MSVGGQHILAQKTDSTLWSWGGGTGLGVGGTPTVTNTPQQISTDKWVSFSASSSGSFGVKEDGTLWAWGFNGDGQLGDGTTINRLIPTQIGTDTNWKTVQSRNYQTTMATKTDGTVWYWGGTNYYGEYGNGNSYGTTYIMTPTQTQGICVTPPVGGGPTYINSAISTVTSIDANGVGTAVGDSVRLIGVVHCQNFSNSGYDFVIIDSNNDGITLKRLTSINGYAPTEGDEIEVEGKITQINGLLQIIPDNILINQSNAPPQTPTIITVLDETTESQYVKLENISLVNGEMVWPNNGIIEISNGTNNFIVNIPALSSLAGTPTPIDFFNLTGIGKQDDSSNPFVSDYQIIPCGIEPLCNIDVSTTLDTGTVTVADLGLNYQWIDCADSSFIAGETGESFTATTDGNYAVIITQGPCVDTSACVFVDVLGLEGNELKGISVYPNPITDELNISNENGALVSVEMIDAKGSVVVVSKEASKSFTFNTVELNSGVYILIVRSEKSVKTFKMVK